MALGHRRRERQLEALVAASGLPTSPGHPFNTARNRLLAVNGFDAMVEKLRVPHYADTMGQLGVPTGVLVRMRLAAYFPGLKSRRATGCRRTNRRSLGEFLGLSPIHLAPNPLCRSKTLKRPANELIAVVFRFILSVAAPEGVLRFVATGIDSTTIQANASMRSVARKDSRKGRKDYIDNLARKAGLDGPADVALQQFARNQPGQKVF